MDVVSLHFTLFYYQLTKKNMSSKKSMNIYFLRLLLLKGDWFWECHQGGSKWTCFKKNNRLRTDQVGLLHTLSPIHTLSGVTGAGRVEGWMDGCDITGILCIYRCIYIYTHMDRLHRLIYNQVYIYIYVYSMHVYTFVLVNQPDHSTICHRVSACHRSDPIPVVW